MKLALTFCFFLFSTVFGFSQNQQDIENEINEQVWQPFKKSFEARDWKTFNSLHTNDVLRVNKYGIRIGAEYKNSIEASYQKPINKRRKIDFCFDQRIYKEHTGYEVGYYRIISTEKDKKPTISYGRFHVVLKKINNQWFIAQDWDTNTMNGKLITKQDFETGNCLQ